MKELVAMRWPCITFAFLLTLAPLTLAFGEVGKSKVNNQLLLEAIQRNDPALLKNALDQGASANATRNGVPALILAILQQNPQLVKFLLDRGAVVNHAYGNGFTPLLVAIDGYFSWGKEVLGAPSLRKAPLEFKPNAQIIDLLLQRGANPNVVEPGWGFLLLTQAIYRHLAPSIILSLVEHGAKVNTRDWQGARPIDSLFGIAMQWGSTPQVDSYCQQIASILVTHGCPINGRDIVGMTPLVAAIQAHLFQTVKMLVKAGADINEGCPSIIGRWFGDPQPHTPLWWAIEYKDNRIAAFLRSRGAILR